MKLSQSNFNLRSPDSDSVHSYLIATVIDSLQNQQHELTNKQTKTERVRMGKFLDTSKWLYSAGGPHLQSCA